MTETLLDPPPPPPPPPDPRRLVRDPDDKVVAGVCAAFGRYTQTDPVLWRVAVAVLAVLGGAGLALYALGWLLVPRTGEPESLAERTLRRPDRSVTAAGVALAVLVGIVLLALLDNGAGAGALVVIGGLAYLVARERRDGTATAPPPVHAGAPDAGAPVVGAPVAGAPAVPRPPRQRSVLGGLTLSVAALTTGALLLARAAGVEQLTAPRVLAVALLVVGTGLLVGTWWGRARWLLPVGLVLALALAGAAAAERVELEGGVGERSWRAVDGGEYALGAGEAVLDLRSLRGLDDATVQARVGLGEITVLVPRGMSVAINADVELGSVSAPGFESDDSDDLHEELVVGSAEDVTVTVDLEVGVGEVEVRYAE